MSSPTTTQATLWTSLSRMTWERMMTRSSFQYFTHWPIGTVLRKVRISTHTLSTSIWSTTNSLSCSKTAQKCQLLTAVLSKRSRMILTSRSRCIRRTPKRSRSFTKWSKTGNPSSPSSKALWSKTSTTCWWSSGTRRTKRWTSCWPGCMTRSSLRRRLQINTNKRTTILSPKWRTWLTGWLLIKKGWTNWSNWWKSKSSLKVTNLHSRQKLS